MAHLGTFEIPENELNFSYARSSGAGGQNVNKVSSKAILQWNIKANSTLPPSVKTRFCIKFSNKISSEGVVTIQSENYRDQPKNKEDCLKKLEEMLVSVARAPKRRIGTKPTRASKERRVSEKKRNGAKKSLRQIKNSQDYS